MNHNLPNYFRTEESLSWTFQSQDTCYDWPLLATRESFFTEDTVRESVFLDVMEKEMILMNMMENERILMEQTSYYEVRRIQEGSIRVRPLEELLEVGGGEEGARRKKDRWYELPEEEVGDRGKGSVKRQQVKVRNQKSVYRTRGRERRLVPKRPVHNKPLWSQGGSRDSSVINTPPTLLHLSKTNIARSA